MTDTGKARPKIVAVVGSPRPQGNTVTVVKTTLDELERQGVAVELLLLADYRIYPCEGHDSCGSLDVCPHEDDMPLLIDKVYGADGLILASPSYYENVSAQMKAFMDRCVFPYNHERWLEPKVVGLIAVAYETGLDDVIGAFRRFVALSARRELPTEVFTGLAYELGEAAAKPELLAGAHELADRLAACLVPPD